MKQARADEVHERVLARRAKNGARDDERRAKNGARDDEARNNNLRKRKERLQRDMVIAKQQAAESSGDGGDPAVAAVFMQTWRALAVALAKLLQEGADDEC